MSDLIHLCPFTIRCEQPSKQIEALSVCPDSLSSFFRYIFAVPAPRGGGRAVVDRYGNAKLEWLRTFFPFKNGIPSHDSLGRVFGGLDTVESYAAMQKLD
jgi:hypothetical protein